MTLKEYVAQSVENLSDVELEQVAEYLAFLRFRARTSSIPAFDAEKMATLYAEFAEEDRQLAEAGMGDYYQGLLDEDTR